MLKFLHKLLNPHCSECEQICISCEALRDALAYERGRNEVLLQTIVLISNPVKEKNPEIDLSEIKPITPPYLSWRARRQLLQKEERVAMEAKKRFDKENEEVLKENIEKLEKEMSLEIPS